MVKFKIGETVFMKCDDEKRRFMVTGILTRRRYREYEITGIDAMFYKQEFELSPETKPKEVTGFKTSKPNK